MEVNCDAFQENNHLTDEIAVSVGDDESRHDLVKLIVHRVYLLDEKVVAMTLHSNYHLVLNHKTKGPTEFSVDPLEYTCGSDGGRPLTCKNLTVTFLPQYIGQGHLSNRAPYADILSQQQPTDQASNILTAARALRRLLASGI